MVTARNFFMAYDSLLVGLAQAERSAVQTVPTALSVRRTGGFYAPPWMRPRAGGMSLSIVTHAGRIGNHFPLKPRAAVKAAP